MRLEIGASNTPKFVGDDVIYLDNLNLLKNAVVWDLEKTPLPFKDNYFKEVMASHVLEHISSNALIPLFNEIHRILEPNGFFYIYVPHFRFEVRSKSLDHKSFFNETTLLDLKQVGGYIPLGFKSWELIKIETRNRFTFLINVYSAQKGKFKIIRFGRAVLMNWSSLLVPAEIYAIFKPIKE